MYRQTTGDYRYPPIERGSSQFQQGQGQGQGMSMQHQTGGQSGYAAPQQVQQMHQQQQSQQHPQSQQQQQQGQPQVQGGGAGNGAQTATDAQSQAASGGAPAQEMNLASVLHYLQSEWRRFERDRNEWEIERAEMRARIALLEGQRRSAENLKVDLLRRVKMLEFALRQERTKTVSTAGKSLAAAPSRLTILQDEDKAGKEDSASEGSEEADRKPNGTHTAMSRVSTLASRASDSPWKSVGTAPPKDPKARARSREYLKQCLQEITYLTSPGALNPLPGRPPITIDRPASPATSAGGASHGEAHEDKSVDVPDRPRKTLVDPPAPKPEQVNDGKENEKAKDKGGEASQGAGTQLSNGRNEPKDTGATAPLKAPSAADTLRVEATQKAPSSPAQRSVPLPLPGDEAAPAPSMATAKSPLSRSSLAVRGVDEANEQASRSTGPGGYEVGSSSGAGPIAPTVTTSTNTTAADDEEQAQLLTAIYRPESKAAWREELRAANAQAERARERSASMSSTNSDASGVTAVHASDGDAAGDGVAAAPPRSDEEQLQSITLTLPADEDAAGGTGAGSGAGTQTSQADDEADAARTWTSRKTLKSHLDVVRSVAFASGPGVVLVSGGDDCTVKVWSVPVGALRHPKPNAYEIEPTATYRGHTLPITTVLASSALDLVFSASLDSTVRVWRLPRGDADPYAPYDAASAVQLLEGHTEAVWDLVLLPVPKDGGVGVNGSGSGSAHSASKSKAGAAGAGRARARLVSVGADDTIKVWELGASAGAGGGGGGGGGTGTWALRTSRRLEGTPTCAAEYTMEGGKVVVGFRDGRVGVAGVDEGDVRWYGDAGGSQVNAVLCHPTWPVIIAGYEDGYLRIWDARKASTTPKYSILAHPAPLTSLTIPPTAPDTLVTSAADCIVRVWDLNTRTAVQDCQGHRQKAGEGVLCVASHAEMGYVASAGADGAVRVWSDA